MGQETRLYQSMFFDSCLDYRFENGQAKYETSICGVTTKDNKNYIIRLNGDAFWPDGAQLTLDDIYQTYQKILIENKWKVPSFAGYKNIAIEKRAEDLVVTFPEASPDNRVFFTNFILPKVARDADFDQYVTLASTKNIGSGCAKVRPETKDTNSVVFDVSNCPDTKFNNYQLKYISQQDTIGNYGYIDAIKGVEVLTGGFVNKKIPTREFAFLFFNTKSKKLSKKIQNTLGGYIDDKFAKDDVYKKYFVKNRLIFDTFSSTGKHLANYITAKNTNLPLDKYDLQELKIPALPNDFTLKEGDKPVYFLESVNGAKTLKIRVTKGYTKITVKHNKGAPKRSKTYRASTKSFSYTLSTKNGNLVDGLNEYQIVGTRNGKSVTIADIDIYYLTPPLQEDKKTIKDKDKLHILYVYHPTTDYIVSRLKKIFEEANIARYFSFDGFDDIDSFKGKLLSQDYDMVIRTVNVGQRNDFRSIFANQSPVLNPSLYSDKNLILALQEYAIDPNDKSARNRVKSIYKANTPVVVLGENVINYAIDKDIEKQLEKSSLDYFYDFYRGLYGKVSLGTRLSVKRKDIFNKDNFKSFITTGGKVTTGDVNTGSVATGDIKK